MAHWTNKYVGLQFVRDGRDFDGVDCYGLICLIYEYELGILLNPFSGIYTNDLPKTMVEIAKTMNQDRDNWDSPSEIKEYDMIQLRTGRHAFHVGIALGNNKMLHVEEGCDAVIERLNSPLWKNRIEWIYRHKCLT